MITSIIMLAVLFPMILLLTGYILNFRYNLTRMKLSPFECGFEPMNLSRVPFSMRFYMLIIIFVVFEIEIILLMPIPLMSNFTIMPTNFMLMMFLSLLLIGLLHEIHEGTINWAK
nr:TPA: NADH dehydrogenase subunit 3 [Cirrodrilus suzukii]